MKNLNLTENILLSCIQVNDDQYANIPPDWKKNTSSSYDISCEKYVLNKESDVEIFNAISINNNGKNDYLYIRNVNLFPKITYLYLTETVGWFTNRDSYGIGNNLFYGFSNIGSDFELKSGSYICF